MLLSQTDLHSAKQFRRSSDVPQLTGLPSVVPSWAWQAIQLFWKVRLRAFQLSTWHNDHVGSGQTAHRGSTGSEARLAYGSLQTRLSQNEQEAQEQQEQQGQRWIGR